MSKHPVVALLDARDPEATEYWLHDDEIAAIDADQEEGRDMPASLASRFAAWETARSDDLVGGSAHHADPVQNDLQQHDAGCPACASQPCRCVMAMEKSHDLEPGAAIAVHSSESINAIVEDYRSGRIDSTAFTAQVRAWKEDWQRRIAGILPGHELSAVLDPTTKAILIRLTPVDSTRSATPDHDRDEPVCVSRRTGGDGPSR